MKRLSTTDMYLVINTYPGLKSGVLTLCRGELTTERLSYLVDEPIMYFPLGNLYTLAEQYVKNISYLNICLAKINQTVERIQKVDYSMLDDTQQRELPESAGRIDEINQYIRNSVVPDLQQLRKELAEKLVKQDEENKRYTDEVDLYFDKLLAAVSKEIGTELKWTQGKSVYSWQDVFEWVDSSTVSKECRDMVKSLRGQSQNEVEDCACFIQAIVLIEASVADYAQHGEQKQSMFATPTETKVMDVCQRMKSEFPVCGNQPHLSLAVYNVMHEYYDEVLQIVEQVSMLPIAEKDTMTEKEKSALNVKLEKATAGKKFDLNLSIENVREK